MADAGFPVTNGSLLLIGMGLLHLGITARILPVTIGLMTVLAGFEILYSSVEGSVLVAALLAVINLGLRPGWLLLDAGLEYARNRIPYERANALDHRSHPSWRIVVICQ